MAEPGSGRYGNLPYALVEIGTRLPRGNEAHGARHLAKPLFQCLAATGYACLRPFSTGPRISPRSERGVPIGQGGGPGNRRSETDESNARNGTVYGGCDSSASLSFATAVAGNIQTASGFRMTAVGGIANAVAGATVWLAGGGPRPTSRAAASGAMRPTSTSLVTSTTAPSCLPAAATTSRPAATCPPASAGAPDRTAGSRSWERPVIATSNVTRFPRI